MYTVKYITSDKVWLSRRFATYLSAVAFKRKLMNEAQAANMYCEAYIEGAI